MEVKRVVANIAVDRTEDARRFYCDVLGLEIAMDLGWYMTLSSGADAPVQIGFATEGGSGTEVPDLSIEWTMSIWRIAGCAPPDSRSCIL